MSPGIAGPRLIESGVKAVYPSDKWRVNGTSKWLRPPARTAVDPFAHHPAISCRNGPRVFVGIDAPDFNFTLEASSAGRHPDRALRQPVDLGPWRPERSTASSKAGRTCWCVSVRREKIYRDAGIPVSYVGHPLADAIPLQPDTAAARAALGLVASPIVALLPGSRLSEVARAIARLNARRGAAHHQTPSRAQFVRPAASEAAGPADPGMRRRSRAALHILGGGSRRHRPRGVRRSPWLASGTATLETALFKKPMVITYVCQRSHRLLDAEEGAAAWIRSAEYPWRASLWCRSGDAGSSRTDEPGTWTSWPG